MAENYQPAPVFDKLGDENGAPFFDMVKAAPFPDHKLRFRNQEWAEKVGLGDLSEADWVCHFGRFDPLWDNFEQALAVRYHGHQFRTYNPYIGDGRGFLFAQLRDDQGRLLDFGTKGTGTTPYSRMGDGRLTLKGGVREVLATQMLEALGVYTSKSFSLIETGEVLERHDEPSPTRASVLVRLSHSHVRFGIFQRLAFEQNEKALGELVNYCGENFFPEICELPSATKTVALFEQAVTRTARLGAQWMAAGFVHGVLNTDNMNITGESFDYGPWRFAPTADPNFTAAYFDETGLYAFGRQAEACAWNLAQLGGALALIADSDALTVALQSYASVYETAMVEVFFQRLGVAPNGAGDFQLVGELLRWMAETGAPYEQVFFDWFCGAASKARADHSPVAELYAQDKFVPIREKLLGLTPVRPERLEHDYFKRKQPCTMLIDEVEMIWLSIADGDDWLVFSAKLNEIETMRQAYGFEASLYS